MDYSKLLLLTGIIILLFMAVYTYDTLENFDNLTPNNVNSSPYLLDSYPIIGKLNENTTNVWKSYPIYTLPTTSQTTNNIEYPTNPDDGTCSPLEFCNAFYGNKTHTENDPPSVMDVTGKYIGNRNSIRVGYFLSKK
jgi:heme/copper-type cytochrome/quinol oxidase subunit 2